MASFDEIEDPFCRAQSKEFYIIDNAGAVGKKAIDIEVRGLVQGVGFRPFVYRIARNNHLNGWVKNLNNGVGIRVEGDERSTNNFVNDLRNLSPIVAEIDEINISPSFASIPAGFQILGSENLSEEVTRVSPDIAVCDACLEDMKFQLQRLDYPFINCTYCGPRFSIIQAVPYDRKNTTMQSFEMCDACRSEYSNIENRRFHAQPIACNHCGPHYTLYHDRTIDYLPDIITEAVDLIDGGSVIAVKGIGGFFLACNAMDEVAVKQLRSNKKRYGKPFAVMFRDMEAIEDYAFLGGEELELLLDQRRPIVLLKSRRNLADSVAMGFNTIGAMLPYMPLHHLLFRKLKSRALVLTSGNISEEPIVISNSEARRKLFPISDAVLEYNRDVHNRVDDSVLMVVNGQHRFIRRSRGYVPSPIHLPFNTEGILAVGAELVNCFAIGKGQDAIMSQHIGDLKNAETLDFYKESIHRFELLFNFHPEVIVCDTHSDYLSTVYAQNTGLPSIEVQHHYAHIASCMAEKGITEPVIGVSFDGTGYGDDGNIWGGEFFVADLNGYERIAHLDYLPMPGGDKAVAQPWRMGLSYLHKYVGQGFRNLNLPIFLNSDVYEIDLLIQSIDKGINAPLTSGMGRLFDAVAAICGLCTEATFHAEAPMRLESVLEDDVRAYYPFEFKNGIVSWKPFLHELIVDLQKSVKVSVISAKFHNMIIMMTGEVIHALKKEYGINKVILSGGTFQNRYILENLEQKLSRSKFEVMSNSKVPANDGGIALGQLYIAANRREKLCV